ncbi:DUF3179 domain-containing protein [Nocardioides sp. GCM10027113]|uniref:DUF3179 domain-containing protein n=1 Tax=unclassified Nocardioides TaxID=2615069 RepID=UPI00361C73DB
MRIRLRGAAAALAGLLVLTACSGDIDSGAATEGGNGSSSETSGAGAEPDDIVSALDDVDHESFPEPLIDLDDLLSGGPPPDGIPSIDDPQFQRASEVDWLDGREPVLSLTVGDETRAYPVRILTWHEIVNDTVDGVPVAVTYCPLCNSGVAFERTVDGQETTFGVSGKLYIDNLVMYDRLTESLWPQLTGKASVGHLTGEELESIPMGIVGWDQFLAEHPDAKVLTRDTGHDRDYGRNPYREYDDPDSGPFFPLPEDPDDRLAVKARVVGVSVDGESVAVDREHLADRGVVPVTVGDSDVVLFHAQGQASALDTEQIADGKEVGTVAAFRPRAGGQDLEFTRTDGQIVDTTTGSTWSILGKATSGPLEGKRLQAVEHLDTFWFTWVLFQPETELVRG